MENKHAYLFMIVNNLKVVEKTLKLLDNKNNDIYIHLDVKSQQLETLKQITDKLQYANIYYIERMDVRWGDYSQVECTLHLLKEATKRLEYQYYHLLSESDMPIKSQTYIFDFYKKNYGKEFIELQEFPKNKLFTTRFKSYNVFTKQLKANNKFIRYSTYIIRKTFDILQLALGYNYTRKFNLEIKYGSNWFSITDKFARYIISKEALIKKMFLHGICIDEHFLQTLICASDLKSNLYKEGNMRYIVWENNNNSPKNFTKNDYNQIINSDKLFARKFSEKVDMNIVNEIYNKVKEQ